MSHEPRPSFGPQLYCLRKHKKYNVCCVTRAYNSLVTEIGTARPVTVLFRFFLRFDRTVYAQSFAGTLQVAGARDLDNTSDNIIIITQTNIVRRCSTALEFVTLSIGYYRSSSVVGYFIFLFFNIFIFFFPQLP